MKSTLLATSLLALLLPGCVSFNLGAKLDSVGKAVPTIQHDKYAPILYRLDKDYYLECEVCYMRYAPNAVDWYPDPFFWGMRTEYEEAPAYLRAPAPKRYLLHLNAPTPTLVKAADVDLSKARRIKREALPRNLKAEIPITLTTGWHLLSADLLKEHASPAEISGLPEKRTLGNYLRAPLVPLISWGVDVPLSIAGSVLSLTVATPCVFISIFVCGERFY